MSSSTAPVPSPQGPEEAHAAAPEPRVDSTPGGSGPGTGLRSGADAPGSSGAPFPTPLRGGGSRLTTVLLVLCGCAAIHLLWCGLTATRTLLNYAPMRSALSLPGFDRAALLVHVQASWIALAVTLNAGYLLWRGFGLAGPLNMVAGAVTLYLYFGSMMWQTWSNVPPGCLGVPLVAALGLLQIGAPISPAWPRGGADRRIGAIDVVLILVLTLVPTLAGGMVLRSAEEEMVRSLEEDPEAILQVLAPHEALLRAEMLLDRKPDVTRAIAESLVRHREAAVRADAWRLLGRPGVDLSSERLAAGLAGEREAQVRLAILEGLRRRADAAAEAAVDREVREIGGKSIEHLARVTARLSEADPERHAPSRIEGARRLGAALLDGSLDTRTFLGALARAARPELEGLLVAIEAAPPAMPAPNGEAEHAVREVWQAAARRGVDFARDGLPEERPRLRRLRALVLGDLAEAIGRERFQPRWRSAAPLLRDDDPRVREAAAYALYRLQAPSVVHDIPLALADREPLVRLFAAMAWSEMQGTAPGGTFEEIYRDEKSPWREEAAIYLFRYGRDRSVLPFLVDRVGGETGPRVRAALAEVLGADLGEDPAAWRERFGVDASRGGSK